MKSLRFAKFSSVFLFLLLGLVLSFPIPVSADAQGWRSNKPEIRKAIEAGGWKVAYFEELDSKDILEGGAAAYFGGPVGFKAWFSHWIYQASQEFGSEIRQKFGQAGQELVEEFMWEMLEDIMDGRVPTDSYEVFGAVEIKGGIAYYEGCNTVYNPISGREVCWDGAVFKSWQPYVAIRLKPGVDPESTTFQGWRICNKSSEPKVWVAYAYYTGTEWVRKGWRGIDRETCSIILNKLNTRYVYFYAASGSTTWTGEVNLCIHPTRKFSIGDGQSCSSPYKTVPFIEVDTGSSTRWTNNLVD